MVNLNIIHMSDLQIGHEASVFTDRARWDPWIDALVGRLREATDSIHLLVLSGDIIDKGNSLQYGAATGFLTKLTERLAQDVGFRRNTIVVPGNHDVVRCERTSNADPLSQLDNMLTYFRHFAQKFIGQYTYSDDTGRHRALLTRLDETFTMRSPYSIHCFRHGLVDCVVLGLNSCCEGSIGITPYPFGRVDIDTVEQGLKLHLKGASPWQLRIAVVHHSVVVNPPVTHNTLPRIEAKSAGFELLRKRLRGATNFLHESEHLLERLAFWGFQLVLHGHQHYDLPIHLSFPQEEDNPYGHEGISVLAAGTAGLADTTSENPGVQQVMYYSIDRSGYSWRVRRRRLTFTWRGEKGAAITCDPGPQSTFRCLTARTHRIVEGLGRVFVSPPKRDGDLQPPSKCADRLFLGAKCCIDLKDVKIQPLFIDSGGPNDPLESLVVWNDLGSLHQTDPEISAAVSLLVQDGLTRHVLPHGGIYADMPHWAARKVTYDPHNNSLTIHAGASGYQHYLLTAMQLRQRVLASGESFHTRYFLPKYGTSHVLALHNPDGLAALNEFLQDTRWLSHRVTQQVLFEIVQGELDDPHAQRWAVLKKRSRHVGHMGGRLQFAVGGGFKWGLKGAKDRIPDYPSMLHEEIKLETGLDFDVADPVRMRCVAISINNETYCLALTFVLKLPMVLWMEHFQPSPEQGRWGDLGLGCWCPKVAEQEPYGLPRDWWEGTALIAVPLGSFTTVVFAGEEDLRSGGLRSVEQVFLGEKPRFDVDSYPLAALAVLSADS